MERFDVYGPTGQLGGSLHDEDDADMLTPYSQENKEKKQVDASKDESTDADMIAYLRE